MSDYIWDHVVLIVPYPSKKNRKINVTLCHLTKYSVAFFMLIYIFYIYYLVYKEFHKN